MATITYGSMQSFLANAKKLTRKEVDAMSADDRNELYYNCVILGNSAVQDHTSYADQFRACFARLFC